MSNQAYLNSVKQGAIQGWYTYKILPSLIGAQAALESGWGSSKLSKPPYNNNFGIKASADWTGRTINMLTGEHVNGKQIMIYADFRAYDTLSDSVKDHAAFFTNTAWRVQNYRNVVGEKDYKRASQAVSAAGYATDPNYASKIIRIIEENNLHLWDEEAFSGNVATPENTQQNTNQVKAIGRAITSAAKSATKDLSITMVADSLGVGTEPFLKEYTWSNANYDSYGSRQWDHGTAIYNGLGILQNFANAGTLNKNVIMVLGTNRGVLTSEIDRAVAIIGRERNLILVDTASEVNHKNEVSTQYREASKRHENVFYAVWADYARAQIASWYYADGANGTRIHMNPTGYKRHAEFIIQAVYEADATNWEKEINTPTQKTEENIDIFDMEYDDGKYYSPKGDSSIYNRELNDQFGFKPRHGEIMWIERIYEGTEETPGELLTGALKYMKEHSAPNAQYTVSMRYLPSDISIGDTGLFIDHEFNPPLYISARVLAITTSESNPNNDSVTLGNVIEVHPKDKSDILSIQKDLQKVREEAKAEFWKEKPVTLQLLNSNGLNLSTDDYIPKNELNKYIYDEVAVSLGEGIIELKSPRKSENKFSFYGKLKDNYIDGVEELADLINNAPGSGSDYENPINPETNPQGLDVPDPLAPLEIRELIVSEFNIEFLDILGRVISTETVQVYDDSSFLVNVQGIVGKSINKIRILSNENFILEDVSFKEDDDYKSPYADRTRLSVKAYQEQIDVTYKFKNFNWTRVSSNQRTDEEWNDINKWNETNGIDITPSDIESNESTFICKLFDEDGNFVQAIGATVKLAIDGKSAYEQAVDNGFDGTENEWIESLKGTDGTNGVPGEVGEDGKTSYMHTAWAVSPMGDGFSTLDSIDKTYVGFYSDFTELDSQDYLDYDWSKIKGEDGSNATSKNYLLNSKPESPISNDIYNIAKFDLTESPVVGEYYTFVIKGALAPTKTSFAIYNTGGNVNLTTLQNKENGIYSGTFKWKNVNGSITVNDDFVSVYAITNTQTGNSRIDWATMVKGEVGLEEWIPANEDIKLSLDGKAPLVEFNKVISEQVISVEKIEALSTDINATKDNLIISHSAEYIEKIEKVLGSTEDADAKLVVLEEQRKQIETYFQFDDSFTIGKSNSKNKVRITNEEMQFLDGETVLASASGNYFNAKNIKIEQALEVGVHSISKEGDLTVWRYIGG